MKFAIGDKTYMLCDTIPHSRSEFRGHRDSLADLRSSFTVPSDYHSHAQRPNRINRNNAPSPIEEEKKETSPLRTGQETGGEMDSYFDYESAEVRQGSGHPSRLQIEEEFRRRVEEEAMRKAEEEYKKKLEEFMQKQAEEEAKRKAEDDRRNKESRKQQEEVKEELGDMRRQISELKQAQEEKKRDEEK